MTEVLVLFTDVRGRKFALLPSRVIQLEEVEATEHAKAYTRILLDDRIPYGVYESVAVVMAKLIGAQWTEEEAG